MDRADVDRGDRQPGGAHQAWQLPAGVAAGERVRHLPRDVPLERDVLAVDRQRGPVGVEREHGAAGPGHADQLGQHGGGIADVLQHPLAAAGVEPAVGEGETRAIRDQVERVGSCPSASVRACGVDHPRVVIDADHAPARPDQWHEGGGVQPRSTAGVEQPLAGARIEHRHRPPLDRVGELGHRPERRRVDVAGDGHGDVGSVRRMARECVRHVIMSRPWSEGSPEVTRESPDVYTDALDRPSPSRVPVESGVHAWSVGDHLTHRFNAELGTGCVTAIEGRVLLVHFPQGGATLRLAAASDALVPETEAVAAARPDAARAAGRR